MGDALSRAAESHGQKTALVMADGRKRLTFAELDAHADAVAATLRQQDIAEGETIALLFDNDLSVVEWWWGARRAGVWYVPVGTRLLPTEIQYILDDSAASLLVASPDMEDLAASAAGGHVPVFRARDLDPELIFDSTAATLCGREMIYSSGTTGRPKGIRRPLTGADDTSLPPLEHRMRAIFGYDENTVYLSASPLYHATGRFLNRVLEAGGTVVVMPRFDPEEALAAIERYKVTHSQWVPTMFRRMLSLPEDVRDRYDTSSMQAALHAAAPCPLTVKRAMIDWWGPIVHEYYGGTENAGVTYISVEEWLERPGSVGRSIAGAIHILDPDDLSRTRPPGEMGAIHFEGGVPFRYTLPDGGHADNATPQGYTGYGDIGHVDEDGYLYISDRRDDLILSGGVNVYPREVEAALELHPGVSEVAVIGIPDADLGQIVCAIVVPHRPDESALVDTLGAFARERLSSIKIPRRIVLTHEMPRNETGKLLKRVLRERYGQAALSDRKQDVR
ncbi:AMP-binding protein [Croceicoccus sp. YJ47]|uniref:AMP-binding protein n=1 Tax=Croceicoccus sp. YJ47 TaxID=2798724 RepID=UPI001922735E|nr:AMP-binding protein [Croceicoccus sp. YJ47]QQN75254.1 AMP-binding protein [Croceicoccus sp. YJ47]